MTKDFPLFQLVDSAFPTGAFAHSFGLETAFKEKKMTGPSELLDWIKLYLSGSLAPIEGRAVYITYQEIQSELNLSELPEGICGKLQRLDQKLTLSKMPSESREGTIKIGKRYLKMVRALYPDSGLDHYADWIDQKCCYGNPAIVHGWIAAFLGVSPEAAVFTHLYASVNNLLQSALRITLVGQSDVQLILHRLYPLMTEEAEGIAKRAPTEEDLYAFSISQEIESMRHATLYSRLFMS